MVYYEDCPIKVAVTVVAMLSCLLLCGSILKVNSTESIKNETLYCNGNRKT